MVTSNRLVAVTLTDGLDSSYVFEATENIGSPGSIQLLTLAMGDNTITLPGGGSFPASATIVPPEANTEIITLKGVGGDTGIVIHPTDPTVLTFDPNELPASFVLNAANEIIGLTIIWA